MPTFRFWALAVAASLAPLGPLFAQSEPGQPPLAHVGEEPIHPKDLEAYRSGQLQGGGKAGDDRANRDVLLEELINRKLLLQAARQRELDEKEDVQRALQQARSNVLINALLERLVTERVTQAKLRRFYRRHVAEGQAPVLRLRRLRANSRGQARELLEHWRSGIAFGALARSGSGEGFEGEEWVPMPALARPIRDKLAETETGSLIGPVAAGEGWHIIKVVERRQDSPPPLARMEGSIRRALEKQALAELVSRLRRQQDIRYHNGG
jgi:peptidyl-prolyl cis-trans isomerase C